MPSLRTFILVPVFLLAGGGGAVHAQEERAQPRPFVQPEDLVRTFEQVCVDSEGRQGAIERAAALPQSQRALQNNTPNSYRTYDMPDKRIGIWGEGGSKRFTCFVVGVLDSEENVNTAVKALEVLRGKIIKVRTRNTGVSYASWRANGMIFIFEDKPEEARHVVLITLQNKRV